MAMAPELSVGDFDPPKTADDLNGPAWIIPSRVRLLGCHMAPLAYVQMINKGISLGRRVLPIGEGDLTGRDDQCSQGSSFRASAALRMRH
jgi:hypothetical protein